MRLAYAVLRQAHLDLLEQRVRNRKRGVWTDRNAEVLQWFSRGDVGVMSFQRCASILELDPAVLKAKLMVRKYPLPELPF